MKEHDTVRLKTDVEDYGLKAGMIGVIVCVFDEPEIAYEVEFSNEKGETICELALSADSIEFVA
ncbi:MAG: DUF4926 domain-containing protein [Verrucomicrobiota bacterium]